MNGGLEVRIDRLGKGVAVAFVLVAAASVAVRLVRHNLFYDETIHLHIAWAVSAGLRPFHDFFFESPVLSHYLASPLLRMLPEGGYLVVVFRLLSVSLSAAVAALLWRAGRSAGGGLPGIVPFLLVLATPEMGRFAVEFSPDHLAMAFAAGAFLLFFLGESSPVRVGGAAALCVLSVSCNPKYAAPLALGGIGFLAAAILHSGGWRAPFRWGLFCAATTLLLQWVIYAAAGVPAGDVLRWGYIFPAKYHAAVLGRSFDATLARQILRFLADNPAIGAFLGAGIAGWGLRVWRRRPVVREHLAPGGVLAGTAWFSLSTWSTHEQYMFPMLVSLCFFAPFAAELVPVRRVGEVGTPGSVGEGGVGMGWRRGLPVVWAATACVAALPLLLDSAGIAPRTHRVHYFRKEVDGVRTENLFEAAARIDTVLGAVPPGEPVIGLWYHNPIFRRDLTPIHCDELESFALYMPLEEPVRAWFDPGTLRAALEATPPGYVGAFQLKTNYPPGWLETLIDYMERNREDYRTIATRYGAIFVRKDLYSEELARRLE